MTTRSDLNYAGLQLRNVSTSNLTCVLRFLSLFIFFFFVSFKGNAVEKKEIEKEKAKARGEVVLSEKEYPILYQTLIEVFNNLTQAQVELFPIGYRPVNSVTIIDSGELNAWVKVEKEPGMHIVRNSAVMTTALIDFLMRTDAGLFSGSTADINAGIARISGVWAHELSHPIDDFDQEGIKSKSGKLAGSQAREIRADTDAVEIARLSGYPPNGLYQALTRFAKFREGLPRGNEQTMAEASFKSHPPDDLRLSSQRFILTGKRYKSGFFRPDVQPKFRPALVRELQFRKVQEHKFWSYRIPKTRLETLTRMMAIAKTFTYGSPIRDLLEYNRLQITLDQMLSDLGRAEFPEESFYFEVKERELNSAAYLKIHHRGNWEAEFRIVPEAFRSAPKRDHFDLADSIPFYSSVQSIAFAKKMDIINAAEKRGNYTIQKYQIWDIARILNPTKGFEVFKLHIRERLLKDKPDEISLSGDGLNRDMEGSNLLPAPFQLEMLELYYSEIFEHIRPWNRLVIATENIFAPTQETIALNTLLEEQLKTNRRPRVLSILNKIWQNRGFFGASDFFSTGQSERVHWSFIFSSLGIEESKGFADLNLSVKEFMKSEQYVKMLTIGKKEGGRTISFIDYRIYAADIIPWADADFFNLVLGQQNPYMNKNAQNLAIHVPMRILSISNGVGLKEAIAVKMAEEIKAQGELSKASLEKAFTKTGPIFGIVQEEVGAVEPIFYRTIQLLALPEEQKIQIYKDVFGTKIPYKALEYETNAAKVPSGYEWVQIRQDEFNKKVLNEMVEQKQFKDSLEVLLYWSNSIRPSKYKPTQSFKYFTKNGNHVPQSEANYQFFIVVADFSQEILKDLQSRINEASSVRAQKRLIHEVVYRLVDPGKGDYTNVDVAQTKGFRNLKDGLLKLIDTLSFNTEEKRYLFERVTGTGPTKFSDRFAIKNFAEFNGSSGKNRESHKWILRMAERGKIFDLSIQSRIVWQLITPEIKVIKENLAFNLADLDALIQRVIKFMPNGSGQRDELLEKIAWELKLTGADLSAFIEDYKSMNWRRPNPLLVNLGSAITEKIRQFAPEVRRDFIDYLINKSSRSMPQQVWDELKQQSKDEAQKMMLDFTFLKKLANKKTTQDHIDRLSEMLADQLKMQIERHVREASPLELTPLFELLIEAGPKSLSKSSAYPENLLREFLKYKPESIEEKMTLAFLDVIEPHERTVSLAYLLSHSGPNQNSSKALFEVFQTAGIKFGQMAFLWRFLGPDVAKAAAELKDNATPMPKHEIETLLQKRLGNNSIKLLRVLGSASIKTVVEVEYIKDGQLKTAVVAVQRPDALSQVSTNLDIGRRFLKRLTERGVSIPTHLVNIYIDNLEAQIQEELKMTLEAAKVPELQKAVAHTTQFLKLNRAGFQIYVPGIINDFLVRDDLLFMEKAEGFPLRFFQPGVAAGKSEDAIRIRQTLIRYFAKEICEGQKLEELIERVWQETAPVAGELSLRLGFRTGWFESDRHSGNFLIEPRSKKIAFIDIAQAQHWSSNSAFRPDEMYHLVRFLKGLSDGNAHDIVAAAAQLSKTQLNVPNQLRFEEKIRRFSSSKQDDYPIQVVNTLLEEGMKLPRKLTFGPLRELLVLQGEGYLSSAQFESIMRDEVTRIFKSKFPLLAKEFIANLFERSKPSQHAHHRNEVPYCLDLLNR